jgi:beta-glucosidase
MRRVLIAATTALTVSLIVGALAPAANAGASCPWVTSRAPIANRVAQLMARMSLSDKLDLLSGLTNGPVATMGPVYAGQTAPVPSLCIPALNLEDGPAGSGDGMTGVTQLPAPVALAATWDRQLAYQYGAVVGDEQRGKGASIDLGPTVNVVRDPRWGRAFETYGEDPFLQSAIGVGYIDGVQAQGVLAQVKHLAAYAEETARDSAGSDAIVSERALQEIYLPPFQAAIQQAHVGSVMCAYNEVNRVPACQNGYLLDQVLNGEFGFTGFVTSDWFATHSAAPSADAGLDMQMPDGCYFTTGLKEGVSDGAVPMSRLNDMVKLILTQMFRFQLFNRAPTGGPKDTVTTPAHAAVALKVAQDSTVLLKNSDGVLPLKPASTHSIAVIGSDAGSGAYSGGGGSASVVPPYRISPYQGIAERAGRGVDVTYNDGSQPSSAAAAARSASVAIVFADLPESEGQDLPNIDLPSQQNALIEDVAAANPRTIVVLNTGSAVTMPWISQVAGVLEAWYPGQDDGAAIAAVLFGDVDPAGKLPVTFPVSLSQEPAGSPADWPGVGEQNFNEGIFVGYRYFDEHHEAPLFPFGFGLSYTSFRFGAPRISASRKSGHLKVSAVVKNVGHRSGSDVVQLYVGDPAADGEPPLQLEGFRRVTLKPGRRTRVSFTLAPRNLSYWNGVWTAARGNYQLYLGDSSNSLPVRLHFKLPRTIKSGSPVGPAPKIGSDSPALDAQCLEDTGAPLVAAGLTGEGDLQAILDSLP